MAPNQRALNYTLTDTKARAAKPKAKAYPLSDAGGLYLDVLPTGSKAWRYSYRIDGKRSRATIGSYPEIGVKAARDAHELMRAQLATGIDPARKKQVDRIARVAKSAQTGTFQTFAKIWVIEKLSTTTARTQKQTLAWLKNDVYPAIGSLPLGQVHPADILKLLEGMRNTPTKATSIRAIIERIYGYAAQKLLVTINPATPMRGLVDKPAAKHYQHLTRGEVRGFLQAVRACGAHAGTRLAVEFLMLTAVRKDNVCKARWEHFDLAAKTWTIPGCTVGANGFMKAPRPHTVYLSKQAMALLERAQALSSGSEWVFPAVTTTTKPMGDVAINHLFSRLREIGEIPAGFAPHGLRGTASTMMNEEGIAPDVVEAILAHKEKNTTRGSYNHATYTNAVTDALQWYADQVDKMVAGANVIPLRAA